MRRFLFRRSPWQRRISIAFGLYSAVLATAYGIYLFANRSHIAESSIRLGIVVSAIAFSALGALLIYYRPENTVSWLLVVVALMLQTSMFQQIAFIAITKGNEPTLGLFFLSGLWWWISGLASSILAFMFVLFPTGRLPSRRWRPVVWLLLLQLVLTVGFVLFMSFDALRAFAQARAAGDDLMFGPPADRGASGVPRIHLQGRAIPETAIVIYAIGAIALLLIAAAFWSQVTRFRRGEAVERQQIKWVLYVMILWAILAVALVFPGLFPEPISSVLIAVATTLFAPLIPVAITVAILHYRLYDIDIIINRTLVYGTLTVVLALLYYAVVVLLQNLLAAVSRQDSPVVIVVSTLVIAALFNPLRRRIQTAIDRRFYRRKYDAETVLTDFAAAARVETDLDALSAELLNVIDKTMQPESVSMWLNER